MFLPHSLVKLSIVGSLREVGPIVGSVLDLRPPGFKFRILCLDASLISLISPSSGGSPAQFSLYVHKSGLKPDSFHFGGHLFLHSLRTFLYVTQLALTALTWGSECLSPLI